MRYQPLFLVLIPMLLIIPGLYGAVQLHPYEYIYYNQFIGGTEKAFRKYETDYWVTSYRAAAYAINESADPESPIYVWGPVWIVEQYTREDLQIHPIENMDVPIESGAYIILPSRYDYDLREFPDSQTVYEVMIDEIVLSVVKYIPSE
jgi:hypothetical protein